jgi:DNA-binding Lrp family transcriptional regulator
LKLFCRIFCIYVEYGKPYIFFLPLCLQWSRELTLQGSGKMGRKDAALDCKDLKIVDAIDRLGQVSTKQLSRSLNLPSRTIRYRLSRLRERGFLQPQHALIHERKLGLRESILVMQEEYGQSTSLLEHIDATPFFYWCSPTYGKYDGYLVHSVVSLAASRADSEIVRRMRDNHLISDYYWFEVVDYERKSGNLACFDPEKGWMWDWTKWESEIEKCVHGPGVTLNMEENPKLVDSDSRDIRILKQIQFDSNTTLKQLANMSGLSEAQVSKRIRRLQKAGVIKGYKSVFNPTPDENLLSFYCFLELKEPPEHVLSCFYMLPFSLDVLMESRTRFCLRFGLPAGEFNGFLKGFGSLKPHLTSYFFQIVGRGRSKAQQIYDLYDPATNRWKLPT